MRRIAGAWLAIAWLGFAVLPWSAIGGRGFFSFQWLAGYPLSIASAPALVQLVAHGRSWFAPLLMLLMLLLAPLTIAPWHRANDDARHAASNLLIAIGSAGLIWIGAIALAIDINGWTWKPLARVFGELPGHQPGLGYGALVVAAALLAALCKGLALRGYVRGDGFVATALGASIALVSLFTLYPLARMFANAFVDASGHFSPSALAARVASSNIWGVGGIVWNTIQLGLMTALAATLLALAFVILVTRSKLPARRLISLLSVLPMITPPFVIGLALIMLFGRSGAGERAAAMGLRHPADALDLRIARRVARANARADAGCVPRAGRHFGGHQRVARGGRADASGIAVAHVRHRHAAADGARHRQRVPDRVHRKSRRFRQPAAPRRQPRSAFHGHLLRRRRRATGSGARIGARRDPAFVVARIVRDPAAAARAPQLHHNGGERGCGTARATAAVRDGRSGSVRAAVGGARGHRLCDDFHRRFFREVGIEPCADVEALRDGVRRVVRRGKAVVDGRRLELVLHNGDDRVDRGTAHRCVRACSRVAARSPALRRQARIRVHGDAELRRAGNRRRHRVHRRVQRAADRARVHRPDPRRLLRVPRHDDKPSRRTRGDESDRPEPRRGVGD